MCHGYVIILAFIFHHAVTSAASGVGPRHRSSPGRFFTASRVLPLTYGPHAKVFTRDGALIANFSQEGAVRARVYGPKEPGGVESKL